MQTSSVRAGHHKVRIQEQCDQMVWLSVLPHVGWRRKTHSSSSGRICMVPPEHQSSQGRDQLSCDVLDRMTWTATQGPGSHHQKISKDRISFLFLCIIMLFESFRYEWNETEWNRYVFFAEVMSYVIPNFDLPRIQNFRDQDKHNTIPTRKVDTWIKF